MKIQYTCIAKKSKEVHNKPMSEQNYKIFWDEALNQLHEEYKQAGRENEFIIWFKMDYVEDTIDSITVSVSSDFMWSQMVSLGYKDAIQNKITELTGQDLTLKYIVVKKVKQNNIAKAPIAQPAQVSTQTIQTSTSQPQSQIQTTEESVETPKYVPEFSILSEDHPEENEIPEEKVLPKHPLLKENYTFESFVPGENSTFAYNVALAVAKNPGRAYNPILIYGGVGLGKTHLMQSIGNKIYSETGDASKICYITAENFTNEFTSSIVSKSTEKFKAKYRKLKVLLLDDIHFFINKQGIQEELFHTFEALSQINAQMVFTCDRPITELKGIEDRLKTRFSSGICLDLMPPNYETRCAIIQKKLSLLGKSIEPEVIEYIAKNVQTNVRDLEGCIKKMLAYAEITQRTLTIEIAQDLLRDAFSQPVNGSITVETIQKVVANHYNISISDMKSNKRPKKFVIPRQIAIYIARQLTEYSFPELGNEFGGRDHTTVMHSYEKVENLLKTDSSLDSTIQMLIREIKDFKR